MIAKNHPVISCKHIAFLYVNQELIHKDGTLQFVQTLSSLFLTPGCKLQEVLFTHNLLSPHQDSENIISILQSREGVICSG